MDTLCTTQRESNLTTTMLQDIPTFEWQDSSKLEDWFMDIEIAADILTENHTCLAEAKSCGLTHMLIHKATKTGKCSDEIKDMLRLKLHKVNIHTYTSHFMEIQQKDNETLAAYVYHFKTAAKWCAFDNDTAAIHIFVKGLRDAPTIRAKIYEKGPQTLAEVIRLVEKLHAAHQLTATLTPSTVSMMSSDIDILFVDTQIILAATTKMPSVITMMNLVILPRTASTRFLHQEHYVTKMDLVQGINTPPIKGTDHTPIMVPCIGDISADHSPAAVPTMTEAAVLESTPHALFLATTTACATPQLIDAPVTPHAVISTGIVTPHPALANSTTDFTHTTPQTRASLAPATPITQHRNLSLEKPQSAQDLNRPWTPLFKDCHHPGFPFGFFIRFSHSDPLNY